MNSTIIKSTCGKLAAIAAICVAATLPSYADTTITENLTLGADTDWRGSGVVTVPEGVTVDLNGHTLWVSGLAGKGTFTSSVASTFLDLTSAAEAAMRASATTNGVVKELVANNKFPVAQAFDNDNGTITYDTTSKLEINYDFGENTVIDGYRILFNYSGNNGSYPKAWTFDGSDDGTSWTVLDTQASQTFAIGTWKEYAFYNAVAYRYYRLNVTATSKNNALHISELEFGRVLRNSIYVEANGIAESDISAITLSGGVSIALPEGDTLVLSGNLDLSGFKVDGTIDLNGHTLTVDRLDGVGAITDTTEFDLTDADATRVSATNNTFLSTGPAAAAFGNYASYNGSGHRVIAQLAPNWSKMPIRIDYDFREATVVNAYRIMLGTADSAPARAPKSFSFYGMNDGDVEWTLLDSRMHETGWSASEERQYEFANATPYRYYRIAFHKAVNADYLEFFKLEYGNIDAAGHLRVVVPNGSTIYNKTVSLTGNLRFVKDGDGTLVVTKTGQSYRGGTEIAGGTLKPGASGGNHPFGAEGGDIVVHDDAVLDAAGQIGFGKYEITLDGGDLRNTEADFETEANTQFRRVRLTKDSSLTATRSMFFGVTAAEGSTINLGGHKLTVSIANNKYLRFYDMTILDGTFDIVSGGFFVSGGTGGTVATNNVDFLAQCLIVSAEPISVDNYTAKWISAGASKYSDNRIRVYGTFIPATPYFHGVEMQDGSTIDLTGWSGGWPLESDLSEGVKDVMFASGASVKIDISGRTDLKALAKSADPYLFTWPVAEGVPVVPGAEFVLDPATASAGFKVKKDATGLRLIYGKGFMIIVK